ncbi:MAG: SRPBCC family protein [Pseudomonadota bacterium]
MQKGIENEVVNQATKQDKVSDRIEKRIELKAPISRVWNALTDYQAFGEWFRVKLEHPFVVGEISRGYITYPGYEHYKWEAVIQQMEPERLFSFSWHPYAIDLSKDYSNEPQTLIEFRLEAISEGTLLLLTETGFNNIPADRRAEAFRMNNQGWTEQMKNIERYVSA